MAHGRAEASLAVAANHAAYAGHFPGRPILPAVVLLAEALAAIESATGVPPERWTVANAKFLIPVTPGMALTLAHEPGPNGARRFEIRAAEGIVASGTLSPALSR